MKKALKHLPTIVFILFIYAMAILFFVLPKSHYSSSEKRYLKEFPQFNSDTFFSGDFGEEFETYLSDHTAFRNFYVGLNSYYNLSLSNPLSNGIYHCKDGYLINDPVNTDRFMPNIEVIAEFAAKQDIKSTMVLAPSTGYVANDVLPNKHIIYNDDELFSQASDVLKNSGVTFVDIRDDFKAAYKSGTQVYYKTDHHWTASGAHLAYNALGSALSITPYSKDNYNIDSHTGFYGTTYSSSGFWYTQPDNIELWYSKQKQDINVTITDGGKTIESDSLFFTDRLTEDDKYPVYLDGNHPYTVIKNQALKDNDQKLLVIKDSFAHSLVPFLADHYSEIIMIDMRYYKQNVTELIKNTGVDQILFIYSIDNLATDADVAWLE